jgi:hypothetical protein
MERKSFYRYYYYYYCLKYNPGTGHEGPEEE